MNIVRTAINRPVTVSMFVIAVLLFGIVSLQRLPLNLLPDISYPSLTIQTDYADAAPEEIENLVTRSIEEAVGVVAGLTRISSISRSGQSEVVIEFGWDTDMNLAALDVRQKLDLVTLPRDAEKSVILRFDPSYDPIMRLRLNGDISLSRLRYLAERDLKKALESTQGVAAIKVIGGIEEQIRVEIDEKRLAELGISITEVSQALGQENLNQAAGSLYDLDANYLVRMLNQFRSVDEINRVVVRNREGRRITLKDIAKVWRGPRERTIIARLDGKDSVELAIYKEGDANAVAVASAVEDRMEQLLEKGFIPKEVHYQTVFNQAEFIEYAVRSVLQAALWGGLLATLILFLFLRDLRSTTTIAFSIPISIMATFALMYQTEISLNIMSLGGVALGVGMLVDNSIVVLESVHRQRKRTVNLAEAVYRGTREVGTAVTASTLTTVAVFLPLVFVEGIAGQLFRDQALTITFALLASLLVALTVIPTILSVSPSRSEPPTSRSAAESPAPVESTGKWRRRAVRVKRGIAGFVFWDLPTVIVTDLRRLFRLVGRTVFKLVNPLLESFERLFEVVTKLYRGTLVWCLDSKPLVIAAVVALAVVAAPLFLRLGAELIPPLTQGEFAFEIKLPQGTPLEETDKLLLNLEHRIAGLPQVATVFSSVGGSTKNQFARDAQEEHFAQLYVVMADKRNRALERQTVAEIRQQLAGFPEVNYTFTRPTLFSFKTPVEVEILAFDLRTLREVADQVAAGMQGIAGLSDIRTSTQLGNPEVHVRFDREKLARLGLDETQISNILRNKIRGDVATRYHEQDRQIDILVRAQESNRQSIQDLQDLVINASAPVSREENPTAVEESANRAPVELVPIRLGAVADISIGRGPAEIRRIRSQRAALVSANLSGRALSSVSAEIEAQLQELRALAPANTTFSLGGQNEELNTSYTSLKFALSLAIFMVYLVMASQFESLIYPFVILFTVPLGLIGVVLALYLTAGTINVMVFLGVIVLSGIVVNNAIVLVDYTNRLRRRGLPRRSAIVEAGTVRLRPIMMTTLTTVLGLLPMALSMGEGAEIRAPMAITVIGGLLFSTFLTLIFIPVLYECVDRKPFPADSAAASRNPETVPVSGLRPATGEGI